MHTTAQLSSAIWAGNRGDGVEIEGRSSTAPPSRRRSGRDLAHGFLQNSNWNGRTKEAACRLGVRCDTVFFAALVLALNFPLVSGIRPTWFAFQPSLVMAGEWWRLFTHPFVHVSAYHAILDGTAFLLLYSGLKEPLPWKRLSLVAVSALGALVASIWAAPAVQIVGLSGLSGIAHGLLAVSGLEALRSADKPQRRVGWITFAIAVAKSATEAATGDVIFSSLHPASIGVPIAVCHAGGVIGALSGYLLLHRRAATGRG